MIPHQAELRFDGNTYDPEKDQKRLGKQTYSVFSLMKDGTWRSLSRISHICQAPEASISARLRDLRKERFGGHSVERRRLDRGLFEYRLVVKR